MQTDIDLQSEKTLVKQTIEDCIQWPFPEKNVERLRSSVAKDSSFFIFHPDAKSTIVGYDAFEQLIENLFMHEEMKPISTTIKDLRIHLAQSGGAMDRRGLRHASRGRSHLRPPYRAARVRRQPGEAWALRASALRSQGGLRLG